MPSPNKYHSSGRRYSVNWDPRGESSIHYLVRGYIHPVGSFQNYAEPRQRPLNLGIKKANRLAEALGHRFSKARFYGRA